MAKHNTKDLSLVFSTRIGIIRAAYAYGAYAEANVTCIHCLTSIIGSVLFYNGSQKTTGTRRIKNKTLLPGMSLVVGLY